MNAKDALTLAVVGGLGFFLYRMLSQLPKIASDATDSASTAIANLWVTLTQQPPMTVLGSVVFPDSNTVAISSLPIRSDGAGNVYTQYNGHVYQLQPSNAQGNWPAIQVA